MPNLSAEQPTARKPAVLLDYDGTMARSLHLWPKAFMQSLKVLGYSVDLREATRLCYKTDIRDTLNEKQFDLQRFGDLVWEEMDRISERVEPYPELKRFLTLMREHMIPSAVVTNSRFFLVDPHLQRWGCRDLFDAVVTADDVVNPKPHEEPVHLATHRIGASGRTVYMVGDSLADINAAKAAGVLSVAFSPDENHQYHSRQLLLDARPDYIVSSYEELAELILPNRRT